MKEIKRTPIIDFKKSQNLSKDIKIQGNILLSSYSENETLYILTDSSFFYYKEKGKSAQEFFLIPSVSRPENKFQTEENKAHLWHDKYSFHTIIHSEKRVFYFNPSFRDGPKEINLFNGKYIEPYAMTFYEKGQFNENNIEILFSDYYSDIYNLIIDVNNLDKIQFNLLYKLRNRIIEKDEENFEFDLFYLEDYEIITDIKILNLNLNEDPEKKNEKTIIAVTKNTIFKFEGSGTLKEIFDEYAPSKDNFLKVYKKFSTNNQKNEYENCKINLIENYFINKSDKKEMSLLMGWMSSCGYIIEEMPLLNNKYISKDNYSIYPYVKYKFDGTKDFDSKPKMICQSKLFIFFLYSDSVVIFNKMSKNLVHVEYVLKYNEIYYVPNQKCLILSSNENIIKLNLDKEEKYLWENYIEIGNYDLAIKYLPEELQYLAPKLHRLNAEKYFREEKYDLSMKEYILSDEIFENICVKFISKNQYIPLLHFLIETKNSFNKENTKEKKTAKKYLIYTWIAELLMEQESQIDKSGYNIKKYMDEIKLNHLEKYIDKNICYDYLLMYNKQQEFIDFATLKGDYELIIQKLLNHLNYEEILNKLDKFINSDIDETIMKKLIKIFFEYSNFFMKESPVKTINLLEKELISEFNQDEIINVIIDSDIKSEVKNNNYENILNYIRKLIKKNISNKVDNNKSKTLSKSTINNLHNLYILILSLSDKPEHKKEVIEYLKGPLYNYSQKNTYLNITLHNKEIYIDLNFAQKILKNNYCALALVYCLMGRYNESILIALEHNEKDIAIFIAQNIKDEKIKKDIWLRIFKYFKTNNFADAKNILESSCGVLKIEDILPFMMDNVKLEELKTDLQACINFYEKGVIQLKQEINDYNQSTELIKKEIFKIQKKSAFINYTQIKCEKCQKDILGNKFFLFPCGHIFDINCLIKIMDDYDQKNIGDDLFKQKIKKIKNFRDKIKLLEEKKKKIMDEKKNQNNNLINFKVFFNFINTEKKEEFSNEEQTQLNQFQDNLYKLLKEECALCGKEMINSTQIKLGEDDNHKWDDLV